MNRAFSLETNFESLSRCLTLDSAERVADFQIGPTVHARVEVLAERANDGNLASAERAEYETLIEAADFVALLQTEARRRLSGA